MDKNQASRCCCICQVPAENLTDLKHAKVYSGIGAAFTLQLCEKHYYQFFLVGQYRFLEDYDRIVSQWFVEQKNKDAISSIKTILEEGRNYVKKRLLEKAS